MTPAEVLVWFPAGCVAYALLLGAVFAGPRALRAWRARRRDHEAEAASIARARVYLLEGQPR